METEFNIKDPEVHKALEALKSHINDQYTLIMTMQELIKRLILRIQALENKNGD